MNTGHGTRDAFTDLSPLPGKAILELLPAFAEKVDSIWIPTAHRGSSWIGRVLAVTPFRVGKSEIWVAHRKRYVNAAYLNESILKTIGHIACASDGIETRYKDKDLLIVRLEHLAATLPENAEVATSEEDVPRCRHCRSEGEGNIMLHVDGHCPKCGRNRDGRKPETWTPRIARNDH